MEPTDPDDGYLDFELDVASIEWLRPPPYAYDVLGFDVEGEVTLGFQSADHAPAHLDIIPDAIHDAVTTRLEDTLDFETIRDWLQPDEIPRLARCTVDVRDDTASVSIDVVPVFRAV